MKPIRPIRRAAGILAGLDAAGLQPGIRRSRRHGRYRAGRGQPGRGQPRIPGPQPCRIPDRPGPDPHHHHRRHARLADHPHRRRRRDPRRRRRGDPRPGPHSPPAPHRTKRLNQAIWNLAPGVPKDRSKAAQKALPGPGTTAHITPRRIGRYGQHPELAPSEISWRRVGDPARWATALSPRTVVCAAHRLRRDIRRSARLSRAAG